jgi:hypothetical protein
LSLAIALDQHGILLAALFLVMRMFVPPLLLAIANDLAIFRICFELPSVIVSAAPTLALRSAADGLLWTVERTLKSALAVDTAAVLGHVDSSENFTRRISEK